MPLSAFGPEVQRAFRNARDESTRTVSVDGVPVSFPSRFPSPADWRDVWIYFLMIDRFCNPDAAPVHPWNRKYGLRQGGTFGGIQAKLAYLQRLGVGAIWISPVVKAPKVDGDYTYPGYSAQDILNVDERFASDGTRDTAEKELADLINEAHARGIYVILDIVLNHTGRVFDYLLDGQVLSDFKSPEILNAPLGQEPDVLWRNGFGQARHDWKNQLPAGLGPDDAVWPQELQRVDFFRRRGEKLTDEPGESFVRGDFGNMRQLVVEYSGGKVLDVLIQCYQYWIARYDFDGFRIDTVKYVDPAAVETFGNAMREFALSIGKKNFFTFGEIWSSDEKQIAQFVGRNGRSEEGYGIDAALDFPMFFKLAALCRGAEPVESISRIWRERKAQDEELLSSHAEASRYFVTFLDNHDQHGRFLQPGEPAYLAGLGLGLLFTLVGIPSVYYGTEQALTGTEDGHDSFESVREALWGHGFAEDGEVYLYLQRLAAVRRKAPALRYGRVYFREVSGNGIDFGHSSGSGGILAFSRILAGEEVVVVANTHRSQSFQGRVVVDERSTRFIQSFSNRGSSLDRSSSSLDAVFHSASGRRETRAVALNLEMLPSEIQIWIHNP